MTDEKKTNDSPKNEMDPTNEVKSMFPEGDTDQEEPHIIVHDKRFWARKQEEKTETESAEPTESKGAAPRLPGYVAELEERVRNSEQQLQKYIAAYKSQQQENTAFRERLTRTMESRTEELMIKLFKDLLDPLDNFERSLFFARQNADFDSLLSGIEMIYQQLLDLLASRGVAQMKRQGELSDPLLDEVIALAEPEQPGQAPQTVIDEIQKGYLYKDTLIRPARVRVVKSDQ